MTLLKETFNYVSYSVADGKDIELEVGLDFCPSPDYFGEQNQILSLSFPICKTRDLNQMVSMVPSALSTVKSLILVEIMDAHWRETWKL